MGFKAVFKLNEANLGSENPQLNILSLFVHPDPPQHPQHHQHPPHSLHPHDPLAPCANLGGVSFGLCGRELGEESKRVNVNYRL